MEGGQAETLRMSRKICNLRTALDDAHDEITLKTKEIANLNTQVKEKENLIISLNQKLDYTQSQNKAMSKVIRDQKRAIRDQLSLIRLMKSNIHKLKHEKANLESTLANVKAQMASEIKHRDEIINALKLDLDKKKLVISYYNLLTNYY